MMAKVGTGRYKQMRSMCAITFVSVVLIRCSSVLVVLKPLLQKISKPKLGFRKTMPGPIIESLAAGSNG